MTDETAKTNSYTFNIVWMQPSLSTTENAQRIIDEYPHLIQPDEHSYKMAKLWLLRPRIIEEIESYADDTPMTASEIELRNFVRELKALEAE